MQGPLSVFILLAVIFLAAAIYFGVRRRRHRIDERLKGAAQDRGGEDRREARLLGDGLSDASPALDPSLMRFNVFNRLQIVLRQAELKIAVHYFVISSLIAGFAGGLIVFLFSGSLTATVLIAATVMAAPLMFALDKRRRRFRALLEQLPDALELMIDSLQSGRSFSLAMQRVATEMPEPIAREFGRAYEEQSLGLNMKSALENLAERAPILDLKLCVTAVLIQREIGGNLSEILRNISHTIRERRRIQAEIRVKSERARLSGYIAGALPFFLFLLINIINPSYMRTLYDHEYGVYILGAGAVMQIAGWLIIRRIVRTRPANPVEGRLRGSNPRMAKESPSQSGSTGFIKRIAKRLDRLMPVSSPRNARRLRRRLIRAGYYDENAAPVFRVMRIISAAMAPAVTIFLLTAILGRSVGVATMSLTAVSTVCGPFLPSFFLSRLISYRRRRIMRAAPDALDLMVICVEAGLGLDAALRRVAREMETFEAELSRELEITSREIRAGKPRHEALRNLADRADIDDMKALAVALAQADRFGTSIACSLRSFADSLRVKRRKRAEDLVARTAIKLIFPLLLCIFPALLIAVMGPEIIGISNLFGSSGR